MTNTPDSAFLLIHSGAALATLAEVTTNCVDGYTSGKTDPLDTLGQLRLVELAVQQARRAVVERARDDGYTWEELGDALGTTRQAAQQRFRA